MIDADRFTEYVLRLRAGDLDAAVHLVREYEPIIRLEVRSRLRDPSLRRLLDSVDVCQSVLASFFFRATAGQYDLEGPQNLVRVLVTMARNKVASAARAQRRQRRDTRRVAAVDLAGLSLPAGDAPPDRVAAGRDLLAQVRDRLNDEERQIADLRAQGHNWPGIAAHLGGTPDGRRKQLTRALDRVSAELGLEDDPCAE